MAAVVMVAVFGGVLVGIKVGCGDSVKCIEEASVAYIKTYTQLN